MELQHLLEELPVQHIYGPTNIEITSLAYDSRAVKPGGLFVAISGFHVDGHRYIPQALAAGASALVIESAYWQDHAEELKQQAASIVVVENSRVALAPLAAAYYNHPGRRMRVIGITGTDGKTTTTFLTSAVLEGGKHVTGMMGTVDFKIADRQWANETRQSTPEAPEVQSMLHEMLSAGCDYAVLESTSHALSARWCRLDGSDFDVAVLTNVTHEHLDFHGSVEQYRKDKARLFEMLGQGSQTGPKRAIVNADDPHHQQFLQAAPADCQKLTYGIQQPADVRAFDVESTRNGLRFRVETPWGNAPLKLQLTGDFNVYNVLAALTVGLAEGVALADAISALEAIPGVRGRMERVDLGQPFTVLVDYAHTPGSFEKLMGITRPLTSGKLIAVFGSAGERDREKRPIQGEIAAKFCDFIVITDEDPRLEDRDAIIRDIAVGVERLGKRQGSDYECIPNRAESIRAAFAHAEPGDIVLLLGKGHEGSIFYGTDKLPWDEAGEARAALRELGYS
jgi:UDP-N-acetylmuramoyl-L-alanyl-D-glutamate--2,6-diaminopimelate ligase